MKTLLSAIVATAFVAASFPASSQTSEVKPGMQNQSSQQTAPGTGGTSKPGTPGLAGSESGPSETIMVGEGAAVRSPVECNRANLSAEPIRMRPQSPSNRTRAVSAD
jgi:hypothetical protein